MTLTETTAGAQSAALSFDFDLAHPPAKVWRTLTDPALLAEWLLPVTGFSLTPGAAFTFRTDPQPGWDGIVHCRLLESAPPTTLRYAWVVADMDTVVTFTLSPSPAGTRLTLVQSGFTVAQKRNFGGARYGWKLMGEKLIDLLARTA